jgi:hypothetical protein
MYRYIIIHLQSLLTILQTDVGMSEGKQASFILTRTSYFIKRGEMHMILWRRKKNWKCCGLFRDKSVFLVYR